MALKLKNWDSAELLTSEEAVARYWDACLEEGGDDAAFITAALSTIARVRGMSNLARETGLTPEVLHKALSPDGNPEFSTIMNVIRALGLRLRGAPAHG
jgi:probable addiction module antidote protein